ncbi:MAG: putative Ig domain-containing protein [Terriglobales bacterium]
MSSSSMPLVLSDYHGFELLTGKSPSFFHNAASDGTDIGAIIPNLDTAQTTTLYACPLGACVLSWPFPTQTPPFKSYDSVTFNTSPGGLSYTVDGNVYTTQQTFGWIVGSSHSVSVSSPQPGSPGTQYVFGSWSDSGAQSHTIIAPAATTPYTASFNTQYQLTTQASPSNDGTVTPGSGGYYAASASIPLTANPANGFAFINWASSNGGTFDSNTAASANFTMPAAPTTVTGNFSVLVAPVGTTTVLQSNDNPSFTGDSVTFTAAVTYGSNTPVGANGSVTFTENGNPVAGGPTGPVALDANGQASFSTTALPEGTHSITATYSGFSGPSAAYLVSSAVISQEADNHTVVNGTQYCNQGAVSLQSASAGTPYPSKIFVTGASNSASGVTLLLNQITSDDIQALNLLLVSPTGKLFVPFANAGSTGSISGVTVTLNDAAVNSLPSGTPLASGTFKPGSFIGSAFNFAAPAPAGPYDYAATDGAATFASEFNNANLNGTWELLAQTGSGGDGSIAGGWCINIPSSTPVWSVTKSHSGDFTPGQTGTWSIAVSNTAAGSTSSGTVTVTDTLPGGYTVSSAAGTDWICGGIGTQGLTCTNGDAVAGGSSFGAITLNVNVPANSPGSVQNMATVSGGGAIHSANSNTDTVTVDQPPAITSANAAMFMLGVAASFTVTATGSPIPSLSEMGVLPIGVTFADNHDGTGTLSGIPTTSGMYTVSFTAQNGVGTAATQTFTLTVNQAAAITSANNAKLLMGTPGSFTVTTTGYPTPSLTATGSLPGGVSFNDNHDGTAILSGTPTTSGAYSIGITAQNGIGSAVTQTFTLTVNQSPAITSANSATFAVAAAGSFTVSATGYPTASLSETGALPDGVTFVDNNDGTGTLSGTPATSGVFSFSVMAQNGIGSAATQTFTLTVNQAAVITSMNNTAFTPNAPNTFTVTTAGYPTASLSETGTLPDGVTFVDNKDGTGTLSGTPTADGVYSISFTAQNGIDPPDVQTFTLTVNESAAITSVNNATFVVGSAGSFTVTTAGYPPPSLSDTGTLPGNVMFVDNKDGTGTLSGTPTASGVYSISITAQNGTGSATQAFTLTVNQVPAITSTNNTTFAVGTAGSFTVTTTGYPTPGVTETGALPSGVTFVDNHNGTGTLSGTPTASGVFSITFTAQNGVTFNATQTFTLTVNQAASITSANSTTFMVGAGSSFTVTTSGYPVPSLSDSGSLPSGVTFVDNHNGTGTLSGTPTTSGVYNISFTASNTAGSPSTQTFTLTVNQVPAITSSNSTTFLVGTSGSFTVTTTGYPTSSLSETGTLPGGVTFVDNHNGTATLSGTPSSNGIFSITFTAQNGVSPNATQTFTLTVNQVAAITSANSTSFTSGTPAAFTVTTTGYPVPSLSESGALPSGVTFVDNHNGTGTLGGTPTASGVFNIGFTASNTAGSPSTQAFTLTVNQAPAITSAGNTTFTAGASNSFTVTTAGYPVSSLSEAGALPNGVTFTDNHNGTGTLSGNPSAGGVYSISFTASNGIGSNAVQSFTLTVNQAPAITSANNTTLTVGTAGSFTVSATGYPTPSLSETGALPSGVSFVDNHNGTATLSGTPSAGGLFSITFTAQNGVGSPATQTFTLTVNQAAAITSASNKTFVTGTSGSFTVTTMGYPVASLSETGSLPSGITFVDNHNGTGTLSGAATAGGIYSISFAAQNGIGSPATQPFTLTVNQAPAITSANSTTFTTGASSSFTMSTTGYPTPSLSETGALPSGVTFVDNHNGTATLSGTPTANGVFSLSITASNGIGSNAVQSFTLTVNQAPAITSSNNTTFTVGTAGSFPVSTTGYPTPSLSETGALPSGVTFVDNHNGTGTLSGTPSANGVFSLSITASNGIGSPATQAFTLTVNQAPAITSANNTTFTAGTAGSFTVTTTGYPTPSFSETGALPGGVTFVDNHNGTGTLSGTPAAGGVFSISFSAQNGIGSPATQAFTLTVNQAPAITSANNVTFVVKIAGSFTVTTTGYPVSSITEKGTLPKGLKFVDNKNGTGTLSGTPTATGPTSITFTASNGIGSAATQTFTVTVGLAPAIGSANNTSFVEGTAGSFTVATSGYPTPSITEAGALPMGVTFVDNHTGNGKLSGTATATGVYSFTFTAQNGVGSPATQAFTLTVGQAPAITSAKSATFPVSKADSFTVTTTGYPVPTITEKGTLPKGVTFVANPNGTATLSGTPTVKGTYSLTFTATNGVGSAATQTFTVTVQ